MGLGLTNATKMLAAGVISAALGMLSAFGLELTGEQVAAINAFADAVLLLWLGLTYKDSPKRVENEEMAAAVKSGDVVSVPALIEELEAQDAAREGNQSDLPGSGNPGAGTPAG